MGKLPLAFFLCMTVFFEIYIFIQMYNSYFEKKQNSFVFNTFGKIVLFVMLCFINIYSDNITTLFAFSFIINMVFAFLIYAGRVWQIFILGLILWCIGMGCEAITFISIGFIHKKDFLDIAFSQGSSLWVVSTIISKLFMLIFIKSIIKFHSTKLNNSTIMLKYWLNIMCIPIASTVLLLFSLEFFEESDHISVGIISAFSILIVFINTIVFNISEEIYRQADSKVENLMLRQQLVAQLEHYNQLKTNDEKVISIIHDIKNTLFCLEKMLEQKQYEGALIHLKDTLGGFLESCNSAKYTADPIIDAFLNEKFITAENSGIKVNINIDKIPELKLNIMDLCLVFGNALDNAIEACNKREIYDSAFINIKILLSNTNLKVEISNPIFEDINKMNGQFVTNKKDRLVHGYGLKNIQKIIEKYNGNMGVKIKDNVFIFGAILPNTKIF